MVADGVWAALTIQSSKEQGDEEYSENVSLQLKLRALVLYICGMQGNFKVVNAKELLVRISKK